MAAASSSLKRKRNYNVFLSFRGTDVRNNFLSHLYTALNQNGLFTYIDSEELRKGEQISTALMKAIEESHIAIIVFSEDYACSPWCLEEVVKIMECKARKDLVVLPVFYKVEPREVRRGRESYGRAMAKHESKFGKDSEEVKRWKKALFDAGSLSGWDVNDGDEAKLIKRIVKEISLHIRRTPLHVANHLVGIHRLVEKLKSMLNLTFDDDVLMMGLWGQGGIGKTTLAKILYNNIFREFEGSCFLANVREASRDPKGLVSLQNTLLSKILLGKGLAVTSVDEGIHLMQHRLCRKKILLVLDDVNEAEQLDALAGDCEWFGKGSRIIITTRDSHLLTSRGITEDHIYEVRTLNSLEALELFNKHAFGGNNIRVIQRNLVDSALRYANGLPLALEVLGSFLRGRREHEWESALGKLSKSPNEKINRILKLSYDGLEKNEKEIFLDIACFFKGRFREDITRVLDACDLATAIGVQLLIEKSLIFEDRRALGMHDLIQMMGMDIVKQECFHNPGKRNRLWLYDDVRYVLSTNMGTNAVEAIVLDLPEPKEIYIVPDAFKNMQRLRVLIMINVHTSFQDPIDLPYELRWFKWPGCPFPHFSSLSKKLVALDLPRSNIQLVSQQFKGFGNLKFINLSECQSLVCMPDISCTPHLEKLDLFGCENLEHAPESVAFPRKLPFLNFDSCYKLQRFPYVLGKNKSLREVYLQETSIEELPSSIENLISLVMLHLDLCKKLTILPSSIYRLQNLEYLSLYECSKLIKFPKKEEGSSDPHTNMGFPKLERLILSGCNLSEVEFMKDPSCFPNLIGLTLSSNNFTNLPPCEHLHNLEWLEVSYCQRLQEIGKIPKKLRILQTSNCKSLSRIPSNICDVQTIMFKSCQELVRNGFSVNDFFKLEKSHCQTCHEVVLLGEEMPKWLLPNKEGYISFVASKGLHNKLLGVAFSVVCRAESDISNLFSIDIYVNGRRRNNFTTVIPSDNLNHVWLGYKTAKELWGEGNSDLDDYSHFHIHMTASKGVFVKECGFRLICRPLGNDLKVLLQNGQLLNPTLLYEVGYEDSQTSIVKESSSEIKDLQDSQMSTEEDSSSKLVHRRLNIADFSIEKHRYSQIPRTFQNFRAGREMPKEFVLIKDGTISFVASQNLYDKFVGLYLCVVFGLEDGKKEISFDIVPHVHGQRRNGISGTLGSFESNHTWFQHLMPNMLWGVLEGAVGFDQFEERHLRFSLTLRVLGGTMKRLGYLLKCRGLKNDLKGVVEDNQLMNPALLFVDYDLRIRLQEYLPRMLH